MITTSKLELQNAVAVVIIVKICDHVIDQQSFTTQYEKKRNLNVKCSRKLLFVRRAK